MRSVFTLKALREQRGDVKAQMEAMAAAVKKEGRALSEVESVKWDSLKQTYTDLGERIADIEQAGPGGGGAGRSRIPGKHDYIGKPDDDDDDTSARGSRSDRAFAFQAWALSQYGLELTRRHHSALQATGVDPKAKEFVMRLSPVHKRTGLNVGTGSAGAYTVAQDFSGALEQAMVAYANIREVADVFRTTTGADMPYPTVDDTGNAATIVSEATAVDPVDPVFSSVTFKSYKFTTGMVLVSNELLQDSAFNLESVLGEMLGDRLGRGTGGYYTTGSGTGQPKGIVTCATAGITTASATAFTPDELTKLANSVDPAYRTGPSVGYMMKSDVLSYAMMLKDSTGQPLLRQTYKDGILQGTINGHPVFINQFMTGLTNSAPASGAKHVLFGDFSRFKIRDVGEVRIRRLDERYAESDQVGFVGFFRTDSNIVKSGAVKYLLQA